MRAKQSEKAKEFLRNEKNARKLLRELIERDKLDGKPIKTDYGYIVKMS
jgi:hypothetical protein